MSTSYIDFSTSLRSRKDIVQLPWGSVSMRRSPKTLLRERRSEIDRGGGLAHSALLIRNGDDHAPASRMIRTAPRRPSRTNSLRTRRESHIRYLPRVLRVGLLEPLAADAPSSAPPTVSLRSGSSRGPTPRRRPAPWRRSASAIASDGRLSIEHVRVFATLQVDLRVERVFLEAVDDDPHARRPRSA